MPRLEARHYAENHANKNDMALFKLAILDFNRTQMMHQHDLHEMAWWWEDLGLSDKLSFARNRLMECFFWSVGTASKPEHSSCREALTKVFNFITIIHDIYDVYGTIDEVELFTNAIKRWDINAIDELPDYMKLTFLALYNTINEIGYQILKQKGVYCIPYLKKTWEDMCKAFLVEAKWSYKNQTPAFEEYINNGWVSVSGVVALTHAFFFVTPEITPEALHCLQNNHDILRLPSMVFRLSNDLATSATEIERGETANAISCYVKEEGGSLKDARKHVRKLIDESWKGLNEIQAVNKSPFSKEFIETAMNLARTAQCAYQHGDGHGSPELIKKKISSIIVDPLQL
ncbi:probable terpene synthase 12 [Spinacia oleracea]|uniref:Probable terpene synthase 12 n=1 Tax=Spinacia oleracea TaxID=3562 RepID=A0A9R0I1M2_SPIOL|nr:probable terpene synthase 12 [Spinacia oleracea]